MDLPKIAVAKEILEEEEDESLFPQFRGVDAE